MKRRRLALLMAIVMTCSQIMGALPAAAEEVIVVGEETHDHEHEDAQTLSLEEGDAEEIVSDDELADVFDDEIVSEELPLLISDEQADFGEDGGYHLRIRLLRILK